MSFPRALFVVPAILVGALVVVPAQAQEKGTPVPTATSQATPVPTATAAIGVKETSLQRIQRYVAKINHDASTPEGEDAVVAHLSQELHVPADSLRQQHASWTLGYGEVAMVYGFSRASKKPGVTPEDVVTMRRSGQDWDAIGKDLGVKVDNVASRMKKSASSPQPKSKSAPKSEQK